MPIPMTRPGAALPSPAQRMPVVQLGRWLMRSGIRLPVPLNIMDVATLHLDPDDLVEITTPRIKGSATPDQLEGLAPAVARLLADIEDVLRRPDVVAYVSRGGRTLAPTVHGGLIRGSRAVLLSESRGEMLIQQLPAPQLAESIAAHLPPLQPARLPRIIGPRAILPELTALRSTRDPGASRVARAFGIDADTLHLLIRMSIDTRATGVISAVRAGRPMTDDEALRCAEWAEGPSGAMLSTSVDHDQICLEGADRAAVTRAVARAVTGSMTT